MGKSMIAMILSHTSINLDVADLDGNGIVDVTDVTTLINVILTNK